VKSEKIVQASKAAALDVKQFWFLKKYAEHGAVR
jgi:hypothetical protein